MNERENKNVILAIDIGGSKYITGFVDFEGNILYHVRNEWKGTDKEDVIKQISDSIRECFSDNPEMVDRVISGGITIPGFADPENGIWVESDYLNISNFPICKVLENEFSIPFFADNDGKACALAEKYFGSAKKEENFLYMTVSTGIGGAFYLNNNLYDGAECHAGEVGQIVVEEFGRPSDSGSVNGIVEMYASGRGLIWNYEELSGKGSADTALFGGREIAELASCGDTAALDAIAREGKYLGRVIADIRCFTELEAVIIGGGISLMYDSFKEDLIREFKRIHPDINMQIIPTKLGYTGAFLGAAAVAVRGYNGNNIRERKGNREQTILRIIIGETLQIELLQDDVLLSDTKDIAGRYCISAHLDEAPGAVNDVIQEAVNISKKNKSERNSDVYQEHAYRKLGKCIGKIAAAASVALDPGCIEIIGFPVNDDSFREEYYMSMVRETYYRGHFPFKLEYKRY